MVSGVFTTTGCWAIQGVAGLERVLEAAGSTAQRRPRYGRRGGRPYRGCPQTITSTATDHEHSDRSRERRPNAADHERWQTTTTDCRRSPVMTNDSNRLPTITSDQE